MALDLVGDRWTLLVVRELGIRPRRYKDVHDALPGIATNLLADRLRALVDHGVATVTTTPPPAVATVYDLTPWGRELYDIVVRLGRWGARQLLAGPGDRVFRAHYVIPVIETLYATAELAGIEPLAVRIDHDDEHVRMDIGPAGVEAVIDDAGRPADVVLSGSPLVVLALLAGSLDPADHPDAVTGDRAALRRFRACIQRAVGVL
jgi:DNA-binding HxlR family transcriptional regulator